VAASDSDGDSDGNSDSSSNGDSDSDSDSDSDGVHPPHRHLQQPVQRGNVVAPATRTTGLAPRQACCACNAANHGMVRPAMVCRICVARACILWPPAMRSSLLRLLRLLRIAALNITNYFLYYHGTCTTVIAFCSSKPWNAAANHGMQQQTMECSSKPWNAAANHKMQQQTIDFSSKP
jgi:hypothetical protein